MKVFKDILNLENMKKLPTFQCVLVQCKKYHFQKVQIRKPRDTLKIHTNADHTI